MADLTPLINIAIAQLPAIFAFIRDAHREAHPNDPPVTDADVILALNQAVESSVRKDDLWLQIHGKE